MSDDPQIIDLEDVQNYAKILTKDAYTLAISHFYRANWWGRLHYVFGGLAIILSVTAGSSFLSESEYSINIFQQSITHEKLAGLSAFLSSIMIALVTFLKPHKEEQDHYRAGSRFISLYYDARVFCEVESVRKAKDKNQLSEIRKLLKEMEEIDKISPRIPEVTYEKAFKNSKEYFDNEPIRQIA